MTKNMKREISVFMASPGDLAPERKTFKDTIDSLNSGFADGAGVKFMPLAWEEMLAETGRRTQSVINRQIEQSDLFILALHRRWGQAAPDSKFSSYTEEEFQLALSLWKTKRSPEILIFFKTVDNASIADPGTELKKVLAFRKKLEQRRDILMRTFSSEAEFGKDIDQHLRAFARGEWNDLGDDQPEVNLSGADVSALEKANSKASKAAGRVKKTATLRGRGASGKRQAALSAKADLSLVVAHQTDLTLARAAVDAANDGRLQDARILFAKATEGTTELSVLSIAAEFFRQIGDQENASRLVQRQAAIARDRSIAARHYMALIPKGLPNAMSNQIQNQLLAQFPEEVADEIRAIAEEAFGGEGLEKFLLEMAVKHFTTGELIAMARYLATPEGQSSLQKQPIIAAECMKFGGSEFQRILLKRHPELKDEIGDVNAIAQAQPISIGPPGAKGGPTPGRATDADGIGTGDADA